MKLTPETWKQLEPLLARALDLEPGSRAEWLDEVRSRRPDLAPTLEKMLATHDQAERSGELETVPRLAPRPSSLFAEGDSVGPYRLIRAIGRGGMGEVWLAAQADGRLDREVALKLPHSLDAGETHAERFRRERDILAKLVHPHIARLYDAGASVTGQPWLAMEYVEGVALDVYATREKLDVPARLALFRQVLAAVAHAHRFLVVHRDVKPANILIDGHAQVKLLDFGIAKLVEEEDVPQAPALTRMGGRVLTLRYAAPEQVAEGTITTATDIYSLGVVLHELLTGASPYKAVRDSRPLTDVKLLQEEIGRPSSIEKGLDADLDAIVLKALRRDPSERYATVEAFDDDIRRHLEHRPVHARAGTWRYLAGRFARRHRLPIALAAAVMVTMAAGLVVAESQRRIAVAERAKAERHFATVRQLSNSLLFDLHDRIEWLPGSTLVKQALVEQAGQYLAQIAQEAGGDPEFRRELAQAYLRLGNIQGQDNAQNIGKPQEALASYERAIALLAQSPDADLPERSRELLVTILRQQGQVLDSQGRGAESIAAFRRGLDIARALGTAPGATPNARMDHAVMLVEYTSRQANAQGRLDALNEALAIVHAVERELPADAPPPLRDRVKDNIAWMSMRVGHLLRHRPDPADKRLALAKFRETLAIREDILRRQPDDVALRRGIVASHMFIGLTLSALDEHREALPHMAESLADMEKLAAADPGNVQYQQDVFVTLGMLATTRVRAGLSDEAIATARLGLTRGEALPEAIRKKESAQNALGELHLVEGEALLQLAQASTTRGGREALLGRAEGALRRAEGVYGALEAGGTKGSHYAEKKAQLARLLTEIERARRNPARA